MHRIQIIASLLFIAAPLQSLAEGPDLSASVDTHFHLVSPENWKDTRLAAMGVIDGPIDGEKALEEIDAAGIRKAVIISSAYLLPDPEQARTENDYIASLAKDNPDRFIGLCSISVHHAGALEEFERCITKLDLSGLKMHMMADAVDLTDPEGMATVASFFKKAAELRKGLPVLIDFNWMEGSQIMTMMQLAVANPDTTIIMAHGLGHHYAEFINLKILRDLLKTDLSNLYVDLSATNSFYPPDSPPFESYMWHLRILGAKQILLGSDYPASTPNQTMDSFLKMGWTEEEQQLILSENAARVFK